MALDPNDARLQIAREGGQGGEEFVEFEDRLQPSRHVYASRKHWKEIPKKSNDPSNSLWDNGNNRGIQAIDGESKAVVHAFVAGLPEAAEDFALVSPQEMGNWGKKVFKELPAGAVSVTSHQGYAQKDLRNSKVIPSIMGVFLRD